MIRPKYFGPYKQNYPSSNIGFTNNHRIHLPEGTVMGTIAHELVHALGLHHEHVRFDRDNFVHVRENLIKSGTV